MLDNLWIVPLLPLLGFLVIGLGFKKFKGVTAGLIASSTILLAFFISIILFFEAKELGTPHIQHLFSWISFGALDIPFAFQIDQLSALMLLVVTGVGALIHIYSIGYMKEDEGFNKFFAYLNLFVFFMLILVLGSNYLIMFIGWEGVGLSSYLLIGFWFKNHEYNNAAKKAFIMNRIGDLGFLLGIFLLFTEFKTLDFSLIELQAKSYSLDNSTITLATMLLFVGAMGKSAQLPLFTWLPDAMAGPTPVSALIHAATMVTAGIYMIVRSNVLFALAPLTLTVVAAVGIATALIAGAIAIYQTDIKKVLAYSTVSQLGMMFMALGLGAFSAAMFHLVTHAFFKALLFLGAGSVIHAMGGEQDIRKMGGLRSKIKLTYLLFFIGTIAISGIPPFSGFFSKDAILLAALEQSYYLWVIGVVIALLTSVYMFRLLFVTFSGEGRYNKSEIHPHESPLSMTLPMGLLALLAIVGGLLGIPALMGGNNWISAYLQPVLAGSESFLAQSSQLQHVSHSTEWITMGVPLLLTFVIIYFVHKRYIAKRVEVRDGESLVMCAKIFNKKFYIDEIYDSLIVKPIEKLSTIFYEAVDTKIIDQFVNSIGVVVQWGSLQVRKLQSGNVGFYLFAMVIATFLILLYNVIN